MGEESEQRAGPRVDLVGICGTWCGACLAFHGEIAADAARLLDRIQRQGFLSLARRVHPEREREIEAFFGVLDQLARTPPCPACLAGGGSPECPVRACARERGLASCAQCEELDRCARGQKTGSLMRQRRAALREDGCGFPFGPSEYLARITRKYRGWNLANLERIRDQGLDAFARQMEREDFRTVDLKTSEDVFAREGNGRGEGC
ncbi:MAG: DUF3795 domain-containing protein [Deltaproteobacteria bacterium]|nr:DUF3795 domain-containing protein [Deltaproteobacteria bacterium]